MHHAAAVVLSFLSAVAHAHPGHDQEFGHLHGFNPELIVLALLLAAWLLLRSR
jgi:hypothetical protein